MKPTKPAAGLPPEVKGVPTSKVIDLWKEGHKHGDIQRRCRPLTWADVDGIVNAKVYDKVQRDLAEGKTMTHVAKELGVSPANVWAIKKKAERTEILRREWGGLSSRAVGFLDRLGYKSFSEVLKDPPTEQKLFCIRGCGPALFDEIKAVVPLKPGEHPVEVITKRPFPVPPGARPPREPLAYVTDAAHYREALYSPSAPEHARQLARFFDAIVKFAPMVPYDEMLPSDVPCMAGPGPHRWCLGVVAVSWTKDALGIWWECLFCKKKGVITNAGVTPAPPISESPGPLH